MFKDKSPSDPSNLSTVEKLEGVLTLFGWQSQLIRGAIDDLRGGETSDDQGGKGGQGQDRRHPGPPDSGHGN